MYLATVVSVQQVGEGPTPEAAPRMEASLKVDRVFKGAPPSLGEGPVVRYEPPGKTPDDAPVAMAYLLAPGDRALVFAASFAKGFPIEMVAGPPKEVALEVAALRAYLVAMDESVARLHGVTPAIRAQQTALYDRILAALGGAPTP